MRGGSADSSPLPRPRRDSPAPRPAPKRKHPLLTLRRAAGLIVLGAAVLVLPPGGPARAAEAVPKTDQVGNPASAEISPKDAPLVGRRATRQLLLTATEADGSTR